MSRRYAVAVVPVVLVAAALLTGCGEAQVDLADDLCVQYAQLEATADGLADLDPDTAAAEEVRAEAEAVQDQLDAFQATAEGRLDTAISTLRSAVNDLAVSAVDAGQEAADTARPAIEDALDEVREAWATLQSVADVRCEEA
jgi:hypothetical protein